MIEAVQAAVEGTAYSFDMLFTYLVPESLYGKISAGMRVVVPFGRGSRAAWRWCSPWSCAGGTHEAEIRKLHRGQRAGHFHGNAAPVQVDTRQHVLHIF